jgi:UDP-N-acetylmuramate--alanine ligase
MENNIPTASRAEVLGALMKEYENSIAIAGTHGKTTTTSMVSLILENCGKDPRSWSEETFRRSTAT